MANYNYVVNSHFHPFSFQERVAPFMLYKDAYDKAEEKLVEMQKGAGLFKYLSSELPEKSRARQLYESYANDLETQAKDFLKNGLTMPIKGAITRLRGRYSSEIGMLERADKKLNEEIAARNAMRANGKMMLFANENPTIDDFLDGSKFNNYGISTDALYQKGFNAAKAASMRKVWAGDVGSVMGYYKDWVQRKGYTEQDLMTFRNEIKQQFLHDAVTSLPGLQKSLAGILKSEGVEDNLVGNNYDRAFEATLNGMMDGAIFEESHTPQRDLGKIDAATADSHAIQREQMRQTRDLQELAYQRQLAMNGLTEKRDANGNIIYDYNSENDVEKKRTSAKYEAMYKAKYPDGIPGGGKSGSGSTRGAKLTSGTMVEWEGDVTDGKEHKLKGALDFGKMSPSDKKKHAKMVGEPVQYDDLPKPMQDYVKGLNIDPNLHRYYIYTNKYNSRLQIEPHTTSVTTGLVNALLGEGLGESLGNYDDVH